MKSFLQLPCLRVWQGQAHGGTKVQIGGRSGVALTSPAEGPASAWDPNQRERCVQGCIY